ncbi:MAG: sensor histidine kinase [Leptolyngbyaceae cyanobacterium]
MSQVFMNLIANAIDALDESFLQGKYLEDKPKIEITTQATPESKVAIEIQDNGMGIPEDTQEKIFEPLFTTKPVGQGTGLGLAIANQIVVERHQGNLQVNSQMGQGTTFVMDVPLK